MKKLLFILLLCLSSFTTLAQRKWSVSVHLLGSFTPINPCFNGFNQGFGSSIGVAYRLNSLWELTGELGGSLLVDEGLTGLNGDLQLYNTRIGGRFWGNNHLYFTADLGISSFLNNAYPSFPSDFSSKVYDFSISHGIGYLVKFWPNSGLVLGLRFPDLSLLVRCV